MAPLGDMVRRRELILALLVCAGSLTIGLAATSSINAFEALSFLSGIAAVTPQVMLPFAADLAPPHKRATAISIVWSGLLLGILIARVLGGIIGEFSSWRNVYCHCSFITSSWSSFTSSCLTTPTRASTSPTSKSCSAPSSSLSLSRSSSNRA